MNIRRNATFVALAPLMLALAAQAAHADDAAGSAEVSGLTVIAPRDDTYRAKSTATATKTDTPLRDVPQAVTIVTDELIRDQAMQTMADVVRYVPGVTMGQGEGHRDAPTIRGNATTADFFVDGVRDDVQYFRDLYNVERVEVLKGPNAMIFGRGGGGGLINRVTKKADWSDERSATVELGSWDHRRFTVDLAQPLNDAFAGRVVGLYERSESFRDFVNVERWGVNPSIGWRNDAGLTVSLSYEHFEDDRTTDRGAPSFAGRPSPAPRGAFFGDPERSYARTNVDLVNLGVEYQVSDSLTVRNRTVYGDYDKYYANIFPGGAAVAGPTGAPATYPLQAYQNVSPRENLFNQTDIVWKTDLGGMRHTFLAGTEFGRQKTSNLRRTGHFNTVTGPTTLAGNPFADPTRRGLPIFFTTTGNDANNRVKATVAAVYLQDQIDLTPQLAADRRPALRQLRRRLRRPPRLDHRPPRLLAAGRPLVAAPGRRVQAGGAGVALRQLQRLVPAELGRPVLLAQRHRRDPRARGVREPRGGPEVGDHARSAADRRALSPRPREHDRARPGAPGPGRAHRLPAH